MLDTWTLILTITLQNIALGVIHILPQILLAVFLVVLGAVVGAGLGKVIGKVIDALKVDRALESAGIAKLVARSGYTLRVGRLMGGLVQWFIILVFVVAAFDVLRLNEVNQFLREVVLSYLPHVVVAVLILLSAALVGEFVHKVVVGASRAADVSSHYILGTIARVAIWSFAIIAALGELRVAPAFLQTLFSGIIVALSLAVGLSFGLGGRDAAGRYIDHVVSELKSKRGSE